MIANGTIIAGGSTAAPAAASRILVIDESDEVRCLFRQMLEDEGYEVLEAADGETGMALCRQTPCETIMTDLPVPGTQGLQIVADLRREFPQAKLIVMSGDGMERLTSAAQLGADFCLGKPISRLGVTNTIRRVHRFCTRFRDDENGTRTCIAEASSLRSRRCFGGVGSQIR